MKLSLVMISKNSETTLGLSLDSARDFVDEIIVVDTGSSDHSISIAKDHGAMVYTYVWKNDFSDARNFALSKSSGDYNLILDSDEQVVNIDREKVTHYLKGINVIGKIKRINFYDEDGEKRIFKEYISRVIPAGLIFSGRVHEQVYSTLPRVRLPIEVNHFGYYKTDKTDRNINLIKTELTCHPDNGYLHYHITQEYTQRKDFQLALQHFEIADTLLGGNEPFYSNFIVDWLYALIECSRWTIALQIIQRERERLHDCSDFWFVYGMLCMSYAQINIEYFLEIKRAFLTCLSIGETLKYATVDGTGSYLAMYNLGVFHEALGEFNKAADWYRLSASLGYDRAEDRLKHMEQN
ncbi:glycosyltransferase family 2 protein [Alicyclobacillus dauci]|uniref:Glycosyltransferase family 2 protein n=1 Tax=Alicyclobacillus dauci TaxID=1475485 RepID=A0ABY6Z5W0_9BACL|nr:glycosyltransferase family 2 protein [Alicyclobacillus dauci]WAH37701.1 glycosyltransferase family 2 protein [Alicyclobacillus dauci]